MPAPALSGIRAAAAKRAQILRATLLPPPPDD